VSRNGRDDGPTLNETTAERGLLVRVLGTSIGRGLSGYIVEGENGPKPTIEFDDGSRRAYDVFRLQMYTPRGKPEYKRSLVKRRPTVPAVPAFSSPRTPAPRPHTVVKEPDDSKRRRQPLNSEEEPEPQKEPVERMVRDDADWNF
jgi:hypothetical protein